MAFIKTIGSRLRSEQYFGEGSVNITATPLWVYVFLFVVSHLCLPISLCWVPHCQCCILCKPRKIATCMILSHTQHWVLLLLGNIAFIMEKVTFSRLKKYLLPMELALKIRFTCWWNLLFVIFLCLYGLVSDMNVLTLLFTPNQSGGKMKPTPESST